MKLGFIGRYLKLNTKPTKTARGKLYCDIDSNLKKKVGNRLDNIYRFIETIVSSQRHSEESIPYYMYTQQASMSVHLKQCSWKT